VTLTELQDGLANCNSLAECDEFLRNHLHAIRPLFYGLTRAEVLSRRFEYEETLTVFENSLSGREIQQGNVPPASVIALLIFFFSLFERAGLFTSILSVANLLPPGSLHNRAEAIFQYKNITNTERDYVQRFDRIVQLIQEAWEIGPENRKSNCEDLLLDYALDALILPGAVGIDMRAIIKSQFDNRVSRHRFPLLDRPTIRNVFKLRPEALTNAHISVRSRIVESLHSEACELVPDSLIRSVADELLGEEDLAEQRHDRIPEYIDDNIGQLGAIYQKRRQKARSNFNASPQENQIYMGTYFPKTVVEAWNILSELLSIPVISSAIIQKGSIRILDIGSGTGAAVIGTLLALSDWGRCEMPVEITSIDSNGDALAKQAVILDRLRRSLPFEFLAHQYQVHMPFDLENYVMAFSNIADQEGPRYDFITCWKCLCEFYNENFAQAQGIIRNTLRIVSRMLVPYGLCILSDVTTTDNGYEYFAMTLNREANEHDSEPEASMRTVLPLPCARSASSCTKSDCYTQRRFIVKHRLARRDESKIAYRVFAPNDFAQTVAATFTEHVAYRVNAARPIEACYGGQKFDANTNHPSGYTGFFRDKAKK
jgi:SAM-dependent methyltransferase